MRRLSRETIRMRLAIALTVLKPYKQRAVGVADDGTRLDVVEDLVTRIMGPPENENVLLSPSTVTNRVGRRHGKWDVDEPHPHPDLPFADH